MRVVKVHASDNWRRKRVSTQPAQGRRSLCCPHPNGNFRKSRDEEVGHRKREAMDVPCTVCYRIKRVEAGGDQNGYVIGWNGRLGSVAEQSVTLSRGGGRAERGW